MASSVSGARALAIAHQMQLAASMEGKPNHIQHVKDQIDYTNAIAETYNEQWKQWVSSELPKMVHQEVERCLNAREIQIKVDEQSVRTARATVNDLMKSIFK